jgi:pimeloyl-ACP methyl ester carboxylesterase
MNQKNPCLVPGSRLLLCLLTCLVALAVAGCWKKKEPAPPPPPEEATANTSDPQWVKQHSPHAQLAVVFVHGIFGDTLGTWSGRGTSFFKLLQNDPEIGPKVDLFAFGFTSNMFRGGSLAIDEAANLLYARLDNEGVLKYPAIVFVDHSMGGLVTLRMLNQRAAVRALTPDIVLFATPQTGAQITQIARHVAKNPALENMLPAQDNIFLRTLNDDFRNLPAAERPRVTCAYEKLPVAGIVIVPWETATRFCDGNAIAIAESHITIVKPDRPQHDSFMVVQRVLRPLVAENLAARLETPDFAAEGDVSVVTLTNYTGQQSARLVNPGRRKLNFTFADISPGLYLWPGDTPKELNPGSPQFMFMGLALGARATEYSFKLRTDVPPPERKVIVKAPDLARIVAEQQTLLQQATLQAQDALRAAGPNQAQAQDVLVKSVYDTVAGRSPDVPEAGRWVYVAEVLNALNWPGLAIRALQQAERVSPVVTQMPSVQELAGTLLRNSGERVFLNVPVTAAPSEPQARALQPGDWLQDQRTRRVARELSLTMQAIPALKAQGLSLQGDVQRAAGETEAAQASYQRATEIHATPSVQMKIKRIAVERVNPAATAVQPRQ